MFRLPQGKKAVKRFLFEINRQTSLNGPNGANAMNFFFVSKISNKKTPKSHVKIILTFLYIFCQSVQ